MELITIYFFNTTKLELAHWSHIWEQLCLEMQIEMTDSDKHSSLLRRDLITIDFFNTGRQTGTMTDPKLF